MFIEWFNTDFFCLFVSFCSSCVCVPLRGLCAWEEEDFCLVVKAPKLPKESEGEMERKRRECRKEGRNVFFCGGQGGGGCDDGKCLCLQARAATFPELGGVTPAAGCCSSSDSTPCDVKSLKPSGPQEQKGLTPWGETEWMTEKIFLLKRERERERNRV